MWVVYPPPPLGSQKPWQLDKLNLRSSDPPPSSSVKSHGKWLGAISWREMESRAKILQLQCPAEKVVPGDFQIRGSRSNFLIPHFLSWPPSGRTRQVLDKYKCQVDK